MEAASNVESSCVLRESRRRKTVWQAWQKKALLSAFSKNQYPSFWDRQELARQIELPASRIRVWFQNRRSRTGEVRHGPKRSSRGSIPLASKDIQEGFGSRAQGRSMPSDSRRPRTRLNLQQRRILVQAFERNPLPGFATREELGQRTGLPEDTIHIWFQNRRARQARAPDQDVPAPQVQDVATGALSGRDHEAAQDISLPLAAEGRVGMENSSSSDQPHFHKESQLQQVSLSEGPGQSRTATQESSTGPLELILDERLEEDQVEGNEPFPLDLDGSSGGKEHEGVQEIYLQLDAQDCVTTETLSSSDSSTFCRESQLPQWAQSEGPGQAQAPTQAYKAGPLELLLDELLEEDQVEGDEPFPLDLDGNSGGKEHEGVQETLLQLAAKDCVSKEISSYSDPTNFCRESQLPQWAQSEGRGQAQAPTQAYKAGPLELLLDELLQEDQVEGNEPFSLDLDGNSGGKEHEGVQETILQLAAKDCVSKESSSYSDPTNFCRESQLPQWAQPEGQGQEQALTQACNTGPLELFLDQLLMEAQGETHSPGPVHLEGAGQQMDTTPELPLTQEEYETLLDIL